MSSKLILVSLYEVENQLELSLRQAFEILESKLRPPFPVTIPDPEEYVQLHRALVYGVLCNPDLAKIYIRYLHAIVTDGYALFTSLLVEIVNELYCKLINSPKSQLIWVTNEMIGVSAVGLDCLLVSLLRRIGGGDYGDENVWLCSELVSLFLGKWDCLLEDEPLVLVSALYSFLRLLGDHCRLAGNATLENVRRMEIQFCVKMFTEQLHLCLKIGRDLLRLLQDLVYVPEFCEIWNNLVSNPGSYRIPGFSDISQIYMSRTSSRYFLLRINPEIETQLRFLLTYVKLGSQKRHQTWFWRKFLSGPEKETLLIDIVRFICCAHHPSNKIIQSDILPRWAVIGWLLKLCRISYIENSVKLAMFYDWLFFDETVDNIMNIEPAVLLMVCSVPQYVDITQSLLGFLFHLVDNYDASRRDMIIRGVSSAFKEVVRKGVVSSLDIVVHCPNIAPHLKEKLVMLLTCHPERAPLHLLACSMNSPTSQKVHPTQSKEKECGTKAVDIPIQMSGNSDLSLCLPVLNSVPTEADLVQSLVQSLRESLKWSGTVVNQSLENILLSFIRGDNPRGASNVVSPEELSSTISKEYEIAGYRFFGPLQVLADASDCDDEIGSPTALVIRTFLFSQDDRIWRMLLFWLDCGCQVGARILSYVARLAHEACKIGCLGDKVGENVRLKFDNPASQLLRFHSDGYLSFLEQNSTHPKFDSPSVSKMVENAFLAYKSFHKSLGKSLQNKANSFLSEFLYTDLKSCCEWNRKSMKYIFSGIFIYLSDLCVSNEQIIRLLVGQLDQAELIILHFEIRLRKISVFGRDTDAIFDLIKKSFDWDCVEQHKLWGLLRSEFSVSDVHVEKIVLQFFCGDELVAMSNAIAIEGILTLLSSRAPTPELVCMVMILPNNVVSDFSSSVLSSWAVSNSSMLVESFAKSLEKLENNKKDITDSNSSDIAVNRSAICWFLEYFSSTGMDVSDVLRNFIADGPG